MKKCPLSANEFGTFRDCIGSDCMWYWNAGCAVQTLCGVQFELHELNESTKFGINACVRIEGAGQ